MSKSVDSMTPKAALTIANGAAVSGAFSFAGCEHGQVMVPAVWTDANIGFQVCDTETGTFMILRGATGTPIQISGIKTDGARAYAIPAELAGSLWAKLWSKSTTAATETDTNQGGARALVVTRW